MHIQENTFFYDSGTDKDLTIEVDAGVIFHYCFVPSLSSSFSLYASHGYRRRIRLAAGSQNIATVILVGSQKLDIVTEVCGSSVTSHLDILVLATDGVAIEASGSAEVHHPYKQVSSRVDQTNILIGKQARVRGIPKLHIATDDIVGGHSCRVMRLGGDAVFYLMSRGLNREHAESFLLNSEILHHLRTVDRQDYESVCHTIHKQLKG